MTIRLELKPEVEARLNDRAKANGVPLDTYLQNMIEELAHAEAVLKTDEQEFRTALATLADMGRNLPHVSSSAFNRESIYQDDN